MVLQIAYDTVRAVKKLLSNRLVMNSRQLWSSYQRHKFLRAKASRDSLKIRVSEMAFPWVFKGYFPLWMPCCFVRIHAGLGTMRSICPRHSMTSLGLNVSQIKTCLDKRSVSFKTGKRILYNFIQWCLFFISSNYGRRR